MALESDNSRLTYTASLIAEKQLVSSVTFISFARITYTIAVACLSARVHTYT
jgi:hypothetical protein